MSTIGIQSYYGADSLHFEYFNSAGIIFSEWVLIPTFGQVSRLKIEQLKRVVVRKKRRLWMNYVFLCSALLLVYLNTAVVVLPTYLQFVLYAFSLVGLVAFFYYKDFVYSFVFLQDDATVEIAIHARCKDEAKVVAHKLNKKIKSIRKLSA